MKDFSAVFDRKLPQYQGNLGVIAYYEADQLSLKLYDPFGTIAQEWRITGTYRYSFNGKESDSEWDGGGAMFDYGFRIYDPRLGRFLSVDPLTASYPWYTPYQFASNMPLIGVDLDGLELRITIHSPFITNEIESKDMAQDKIDYRQILRRSSWALKNSWTVDQEANIKRFGSINAATGVYDKSLPVGSFDIWGTEVNSDGTISQYFLLHFSINDMHDQDMGIPEGQLAGASDPSFDNITKYINFQSICDFQKGWKELKENDASKFANLVFTTGSLITGGSGLRAAFRVGSATLLRKIYLTTLAAGTIDDAIDLQSQVMSYFDVKTPESIGEVMQKVGMNQKVATILDLLVAGSNAGIGADEFYKSALNKNAWVNVFDAFGIIKDTKTTVEKGADLVNFEPCKE